MTKGIQLWPGDRMRAFFRGHIRRETGLDAKTTDKLADALTKAISRMMVWEVPADAGKTHSRAHPQAPVKMGGKAADKSKPAGTGAEKPAPPFDPYAFSVLVVLTKHGRDGLAKRVAEIKSVENLRKLAEAQHLGIDRNVAKADDLRKAIVAAAERRLADRRAAAS